MFSLLTKYLKLPKKTQPIHPSKRHPIQPFKSLFIDTPRNVESSKSLLEDHSMIDTCKTKEGRKGIKRV